MVWIIERSPLTPKEIEAELYRFEDVYGMSTEEFSEAFAAGRLPETPEYIEWSSLLSACALACHPGDRL